ncbi:hypothetical protein BTVI_07661 [Pitangus sulphuratus]|nr:hypothetical protein BTVI_07661 [Pitangus sulphuratus]
MVSLLEVWLAVKSVTGADHVGWVLLTRLGALDQEIVALWGQVVVLEEQLNGLECVRFLEHAALGAFGQKSGTAAARGAFGVLHRWHMVYGTGCRYSLTYLSFCPYGSLWDPGRWDGPILMKSLDSKFEFGPRPADIDLAQT